MTNANNSRLSFGRRKALGLAATTGIISAAGYLFLPTDEQNDEIGTDDSEADAENGESDKTDEKSSDEDPSDADESNRTDEDPSDADESIDDDERDETESEPDSESQGLLVLTYDDGPVEDYTQTFTVHEKFGVPGCAAVNPGTMDTSDRWLTPEQAREMQDAGWEIMSHTYRHRSYGEISLTESVSPDDERIYVERNRHGRVTGDPLVITDGDTVLERTVSGRGIDGTGEYIAVSTPRDDSIDHDSLDEDSNDENLLDEDSSDENSSDDDSTDHNSSDSDGDVHHRKSVLREKQKLEETDKQLRRCITDGDTDVEGTVSGRGSDRTGQYSKVSTPIADSIDSDGAVHHPKSFLREKLKEADTQLRRWGLEVFGFVYPFDRYHGVAQEVARDHYDAVANHKSWKSGGHNDLDADPTTWGRQYIQTDKVTEAGIEEFLDTAVEKECVAIVGGHSQYDSLPNSRVEFVIEQAQDRDLEIVTMQEAVNRTAKYR